MGQHELQQLDPPKTFHDARVVLVKRRPWGSHSLTMHPLKKRKKRRREGELPDGVHHHGHELTSKQRKRLAVERELLSSSAACRVF